MGYDMYNCLDGHWKVQYSGIGDTGVAMLLMLVEGQHVNTRYQWKKEGTELPDEVFPVCYVTIEGAYSCKCTILDQIVIEVDFNIRRGNNWKFIMGFLTSANNIDLKFIVSEPPPNSTHEPVHEQKEVVRFSELEQVVVDGKFKITLF